MFTAIMLVYNLQLKKSQRLKYNLPHTKGKINSVIDYVSARVTFVIFFFFSIFLSCAHSRFSIQIWCQIIFCFSIKLLSGYSSNNLFSWHLFRFYLHLWPVSLNGVSIHGKITMPINPIVYRSCCHRSAYRIHSGYFNKYLLDL